MMTKHSQANGRPDKIQILITAMYKRISKQVGQTAKPLLT